MLHRWALVFFAFVVSCTHERMASRAQCEKLRDRYIDLELSSLPAARAMTPEARAALRGNLAIEALSGPHAAQIDQRCEARVRESAYRCAIDAAALEAWERCLE